MNLWVELDQETFSFEAQLANLGPVEGIYFGVALEENILQNNIINLFYGDFGTSSKLEACVGEWQSAVTWKTWRPI